MSVLRSAALSSLVCFAWLACTDSNEPVTVADIVIVPDTVRLGRTDSTQLTVSPVDARGRTVPGVTPTFASSDPTVVTVSGSGLVRSVGPVGSALVTVSAQAVSRPVPTFVLALPRALQLAPADTTVPQRGSAQLRATVLDAVGDPVPTQTITYESLSPSVVLVSGSGLATTAGPAGTAEVVARSGSLADTATITVAAVADTITITPSQALLHQGDSVQFSAAVRDRNGDPMPGATLTWQSSDSNVLRISLTGLASSVGPTGFVTVTARSGLAAAAAPVTVLDSSIIARLPLSASPLGIAVSGDRAYVTRTFANRVQDLNLATLTFTDSIAVGSLPSFVTFHPAGTKAYVANQFSQSVGIIDVAASTQTEVIPVTGDPLPVAITADGNTLFVTTNVNRLYKIDLTTKAVVDSLDLPATSHHLLVHPNDTLLYVATRDGGSVLEVNWRTMTVARTFTLGGRTQGMAIAPDRLELYVADEIGNVLRVVNLTSGTIAATVTLASGGEGLAVSADGTKLYVGLVFAGKVQVIDRATRAIMQTIVTGGTPREIGIDATRQRALIVNEAGWVDVLR